MRLCFDECLPPKWFRHLSEMLAKRRPPITAVHLLDRFRQGTTDDVIADWLEAEDPPFLLISGDSGIGSKSNEPRLHLLCPARGITSIFIARKLCQRQGFEKLRMMMVCLPALERASAGARGGRFRLESSGDLYRIREWPLSGSAPAT